jgi:hypothetical protein
MKPSEIRAELLEQHRQIRDLMSSTRDVAVRARSGDECGEELQASVRRLAERVRTHNDREEELLQDIIPVVDAWGPVRSAVMTAEHIKEHHRFHTALLSLPSTAAETAGVGVIALLALMGDHMEREEAAFLGEDVLSDEIVVADQSGG